MTVRLKEFMASFKKTTQEAFVFVMIGLHQAILICPLIGEANSFCLKQLKEVFESSQLASWL